MDDFERLEREYNEARELRELETEYHAAMDAYAASGSDEDKEKYKAAKQAFADRRSQLRAEAEERGDRVATVPTVNATVAINGEEGEQ